MTDPRATSSNSVSEQRTSLVATASLGRRGRWRSAVSRRRRLAGRVLLLVFVVVLIMQIYGKRAFWSDVLEYGTFFPGELPGDSLIELVGFEPRPEKGFDFTRLTVPRTEIHPGGPPKDGIPALTKPRLISADKATYLRADDRVIGVVSGRDARAYPLKILNYHEIVNDEVGESPVAVTYCPLCDSAAVFDRRTPLGTRDFGVSGLLYNSNVLMYDRGGESESLWSQMKTQGISGPAANQPLKSLPLELTTWSDWRGRYPQTRVLSTRTGHNRDYGRNPYGSYFETPGLMFTVQPLSDRLPLKERVLGVWTGSASRAYPESSFSPERRRVEDVIDGKRLVVEFNPQSRSLRVAEAESGIEWMYSLWFAWYAFRPETDVFGLNGD